MPTLSFSQAVLQNNLPAVTEWLTQSPPADINEMISEEGETYSGAPIHHAMREEYVGLFELLLTYHPDLERKDSNGANPLQIAVAKSMGCRAPGEKMLKALVKAGASLDCGLMDIPDIKAGKEEQERVRQTNAEYTFKARQSDLARTIESSYTLPQLKEHYRNTKETERLSYEAKQKKALLDFKVHSKIFTRPVFQIAKTADSFLEFTQTSISVPAADIQTAREMLPLLAEYDDKDCREISAMLVLLRNVPTLRQLFTKINALQTYGETLQNVADSKQIGSNTCALATSLHKSMETLVRTIHSGKPNDIQAAQKEWGAQLEKGMVDMREHRGVFYRLLNIFITWVRDLLGIKDASDAHGFFQTNRQKQLTAIDGEVHGLLTQALQDIKPLESEAEPVGNLYQGS